MMAQYLEIKGRYPDALLFYRMGDFYEMFFADAEAAAAALDIALTKRGQHLGEDIPMCGVPVHAAEGYLLTLIRKGFRVAIAEQMEDPAEAKKRGSKSVVARDVVRLVTPGTLTEDVLLEARRHNFLAAWAEVRDEAALAWADISTGEFRVMTCPLIRLGPELARLAPSEILVAESRFLDVEPIAADQRVALTPLARSSFDSAGAEKRLVEQFGVATADAFGNFERADVAALGAILAYLDLTQRGRLPLLRPPVKEASGTALQMDAATRRNLEITRSLSGGRDGSLIAAVDRTVTAAGARLLDRRLSAPSRDLAEIHARLQAVRAFVEDRALTEGLREALRRVPDIDRALSRLALDRGGPRDLAAIRNGLEEAGTIAARLEALPVGRIADAAKAMTGFDDLAALFGRALAGDLPLLTRDGGFIASGFDADLDDARRLRDEGRSVIAAMQAEYIRETGVQSLKIKHNNVLG
ncbi:MAG: DNA mismatch repair protein MutS, partial [Albidovulum sp.]